MSDHRYRRKNIGVVGASSASEETAEEARKVGALICRKGANLVCGGLGGVMQEACRGFADERFRMGEKACGVTVGILPGGHAADANPFIDIVIPTDMGMMRNFLVVQTSDIVIAVSGGSGTLSEMAIAWQKGKTIIALEHTGGWAGQLAGKRVDGRRPDTVARASSVEEVENHLDDIFGR
jgi:uncharacterized protein (TIGR00725 family)